MLLHLLLSETLLRARLLSASLCECEFSVNPLESEKEKKGTEDAISMSKASIEEMSASSETLGEEVASLQAEIKALDKAPAAPQGGLR